jgi:hypothetical protein
MTKGTINKMLLGIYSKLWVCSEAEDFRIKTKKMTIRRMVKMINNDF